MPKPFSPQDHFFHLAKKKGYRARSAFKLLEIMEKFPRLIPVRGTVIDLGSSPGSFLQVLDEKMRGGIILGIDLQMIAPLMSQRNHLSFIQGDAFSPGITTMIREVPIGKADAIVSDMAPNTMGESDVDQWRSVELNMRVLEIAKKFLRTGGNLVTKIFVGADFQEFWKDSFQKSFRKSRTFKPKSSRDRSYEMFLIGEDYLG